jgi:hypothetical protein
MTAQYMCFANDDLKLDRPYAIYPGRAMYELDEWAEVLSIQKLETMLNILIA